MRVSLGEIWLGTLPLGGGIYCEPCLDVNTVGIIKFDGCIFPNIGCTIVGGAVSDSSVKLCGSFSMDFRLIFDGSSSPSISIVELEIEYCETKSTLLLKYKRNITLFY